MVLDLAEVSRFWKIALIHEGAEGEKSAPKFTNGKEPLKVVVCRSRSVISHQVGLPAFNCESIEKGAVKLLSVPERSGVRLSLLKKL